MKLESLSKKVVVITGASSGIGKLAVEELLVEGAKVVMAARSVEDMRQHVQRLGVNESQVLIVETDVSDYEQVLRLADEAVRQFGAIDVWINNAAINSYGYVEDQDIDDIRRIIDVDLMGPIYGMKAVLPIFLEQGYGNLINVDSVEAVASMPLQSAYDAAKHGAFGFSCALREELMTDRYKDKNIDVVDIMPASMDTPLPEHAKSTTGKMPRPMPPIYDPMMTVREIIRCAKNPRPIVVVGASGQIITTQTRLMPTVSEWIMSKIGVPSQLTSQRKSDVSNFSEPMPGTNRAYGGIAINNGVVSYAKNHPVHTAVVSLLSLLFAAKWMTRRAAA